MKDSYCSHCGRKMQVFAKQSTVYDATTGKRLYLIKKKCPKSKWYNCHDSGYVQRVGMYGPYGPCRETIDELKDRGIDINGLSDLQKKS